MYKTRQEVADEFEVSVVTVWRWTKRLGIQGVPSRYDNRTRLFDEKQVEQIRKAIKKEHVPE